MYDSRSSHPRTGAHDHRAWARKSTGGRRYEGKPMKHDYRPQGMRVSGAGAAIAEALEEVEVEREVRQTIEQAHTEALRLNAMSWWAREEALMLEVPLADWERALLAGTDIDGDSEAVWSTEFDAVWEEEHRRKEEAAYDGAYGGYSDDAYVENGEYVIDCWMPYMRMDEVRETFGENWLGNGFHVISPNTIRRTK